MSCWLLVGLTHASLFLYPLLTVQHVRINIIIMSTRGWTGNPGTRGPGSKSRTRVQNQTRVPDLLYKPHIYVEVNCICEHLLKWFANYNEEKSFVGLGLVSFVPCILGCAIHWLKMSSRKINCSYWIHHRHSLVPNSIFVQF